MKRTLKLRKMGMDFAPGDMRGSDCGNHRLRAEITDRDGKRITADFSGGRIWNDLCIDASYYDENGICTRISRLNGIIWTQIDFLAIDSQTF